jgi:hypothetical protein
MMQFFGPYGGRKQLLTKEVKLTDMGVAPRGLGISKEDERGAALAERARKGDYDNGT